MSDISEHIRELDRESIASKSRSSAHSSRSPLSRKSAQANISKRYDIAIEAATLVSKLKYMDLENRSKTELEKIKTLKQLEVAKAKLKI